MIALEFKYYIFQVNYINIINVISFPHRHCLVLFLLQQMWQIKQLINQ